jgi:hypothetical protein
MNKIIQWIINRLTKKSIPILWIELKGDIKDKCSFKIHSNPTLKDDLYTKKYIEDLCKYLRERSGLTNEDFR